MTEAITFLSHTFLAIPRIVPVKTSLSSKALLAIGACRCLISIRPANSTSADSLSPSKTPSEALCWVAPPYLFSLCNHNSYKLLQFLLESWFQISFIPLIWSPIHTSIFAVTDKTNRKIVRRAKSIQIKIGSITKTVLTSFCNKQLILAVYQLFAALCRKKGENGDKN